MLSDYELEEMRATQVEAMPELVTIKRTTVTSDGFGGNNVSGTVTVASNVPARIKPAQVMIAGGQADRQLELEKWNVRVPHGTDLQDRDLIEWAAQGVTIKIEEVKYPSSQSTAISAIGEMVK